MGSGFAILSHIFDVGSCQLQNWPVTQPMTVWPSGLRRWLQVPVRKGVGSNPTAVTALRSDRTKDSAKLFPLPGVPPPKFGRPSFQAETTPGQDRAGDLEREDWRESH